MTTSIDAIRDEVEAIEKEAAVFTAQDRQMAVAEAIESIVSNLAANTRGDRTYSGLTPNADLGFHENLAAGYTPAVGDWRTGSSNLPYDVAREYGLGTSQRARGTIIDKDTGYRPGYKVGGNQIPDDIAALMAAERYGGSGGLLSPEAQASFGQDDYGYSGGAFTDPYGRKQTAATDDWTVEAQPTTGQMLMGLLMNPLGTIAKEITREDAWGGVDPGGGFYNPADEVGPSGEDTSTLFGFTESQCDQRADYYWDASTNTCRRITSTSRPKVSDTSETDTQKELDDFIASMHPFKNIEDMRWYHPLADYDEQNLWGYKPPKITDWGPGLQAWADV